VKKSFPDSFLVFVAVIFLVSLVYLTHFASNLVNESADYQLVQFLDLQRAGRLVRGQLLLQHLNLRFIFEDALKNRKHLT